MEELTPIYPVVEESSRSGLSATFNTFVRIKRDGVWYLVFVTRSFQTIKHSDFEAARRDTLAMFHRDVYVFQHSTIIPEEPVPWITKDPNQEEEVERLKKIVYERRD